MQDGMEHESQLTDLNRRLATAVETHNHAEVAYLLAQPGADPNTCPGWHTLLVNADLESTKLLLAHPAIDPNCRPKYGSCTALEVAYESEEVERFRLLLSHPRTDPNLRNRDGKVLLAEELPDHLPRKQMIEALLAHPAIDPNRCQIIDN